jgi:AbrB family looped-hinge helix DNA binding protein
MDEDDLKRKRREELSDIVACD